MRDLNLRGIARDSIGGSVAISVLIILAGVLAMALPLVTGVVVNAVVAWLLLLSGIGHLIFAWHVRGAGVLPWELLVGLVYLAAGGLLLSHPLLGLVTLTLVLSVYLLVKGLIELGLGFELLPVAGSDWLLFDATVSLILAAMICGILPLSGRMGNRDAGWPRDPVQRDFAAVARACDSAGVTGGARLISFGVTSASACLSQMPSGRKTALFSA